MKDKISEKAIGEYLKTYFTSKRCRFIKLNPASYTGIPDRLVLTSQGNAIFIELKSIGESRRPAQKMWGYDLVDMHHLYVIIDKISDDVIQKLDTYLEAVDNRERTPECEARLRAMAEEISQRSINGD